MHNLNILRPVMILILAAALLTPIWMVEFPPLLDYPNHLARSFVLAHLNDPAFTFSKFYRADWGTYPYLGMDAVPLRGFFCGRRIPAKTARLFGRC